MQNGGHDSSHDSPQLMWVIVHKILKRDEKLDHCMKNLTFSGNSVVGYLCFFFPIETGTLW